LRFLSGILDYSQTQYTSYIYNFDSATLLGSSGLSSQEGGYYRVTFTGSCFCLGGFILSVGDLY